MEPTPVVEAASAPSKQEKRKRRLSQANARILQNIATAVVALITIAISAFIMMVWFGIGPQIPFVTDGLKLLFHALGR